MVMGFKLQMGMGMNSSKWEEIGTENLFPHTSNHKHHLPYALPVVCLKLADT